MHHVFGLRRGVLTLDPWLSCRHLEYNQLSGTVPSAIAALPRLQEMCVFQGFSDPTHPLVSGHTRQQANCFDTDLLQFRIIVTCLCKVENAKPHPFVKQGMRIGTLVRSTFMASLFSSLHACCVFYVVRSGTCDIMCVFDLAHGLS